ncbi:MAG: DNA-formamidopyrimidine glycosylase family protein [Pseudomonadota bacterium]
MPEGDTIHKIANYLAPKLTDQTLDSLRIAQRGDQARDQARLAGLRIVDVRAHGKHLYIDLADGSSIRSHLGMHGSWHRYPQDTPWRKPAHWATLVARVNREDYVCFNAKEVELVNTPSVREHILSARLGPDLTGSTPIAPATLVARARAIEAPDAIVADALLNQQVASGIGNVYKSEVLFLAGLHPTQALAETPDEVLAVCFESAAQLLRSNLHGGKRITRREGDHAGRLWVYRRAGLPCLRCDDTIEYARIGRHHRSTYWCSSCQRNAKKGSGYFFDAKK